MGKIAINDFITIKNSTQNTGEIWVYGDITDNSWWDEDVTPKSIKEAIDAMGDISQIDIRVNCYGGSVNAGNAIINLLDAKRRKCGCTINAYVDGIAASMASGIIMVADKIYMAENAMLMLHKPLSVAVGNSDDFEKEIEILNKYEDGLIKNYMRHFNGTEDEIRQMLADETWLTAEEAQSYGLCDEIVSSVKIAASANNYIFNGVDFQNTSDIFKAKIAEKLEATKEPTAIEDKSEPKIIEFLSCEKAKDFLGAEYSAEEILNYAKRGMNISDETLDKAKHFDKLYDEAIEQALVNAEKARGDRFNRERIKKYLSTLTYDEVIAESEDYLADFKRMVNAGKQVSVSSSQLNESVDKVDPKNYMF